MTVFKLLENKLHEMANTQKQYIIVIIMIIYSTTRGLMHEILVRGSAFPAPAASAGSCSPSQAQLALAALYGRSFRHSLCSLV